MRQQLARIHPRHLTVAGVGLAVAGAYLVHQAYEGRGRKRPFLTRLLPFV